MASLANRLFCHIGPVGSAMSGVVVSEDEFFLHVAQNLRHLTGTMASLLSVDIAIDDHPIAQSRFFKRGNTPPVALRQAASLRVWLK